jgi:Acetoacetate decarboxylase (ADC)
MRRLLTHSLAAFVLIVTSFAAYFPSGHAQPSAQQQGSAPRFYDSAPLDDPVLGRCEFSGRHSGRFVFQENDQISAYFEAGDLAAYRQAIPAPFAMPEKPLIRVSVLDFYEMVNGPSYLEVVISVLALHEGQPGWVVLMMPVTNGDSCAAARATWGYPKVMRRVTLERQSGRYVGTLYARGGGAPEFQLTVEVGDPGAAARELLGAVYAFPNLALKEGRVMRFRGMRQPVYELERMAPGVWKASLGRAQLEFAPEQEVLLHRLGVGRPLAAYWARLRARWSIGEN